eukprot:1160580-Pelagomonas_calceolata.AAC.13
MLSSCKSTYASWVFVQMTTARLDVPFYVNSAKAFEASYPRGSTSRIHMEGKVSEVACLGCTLGAMCEELTSVECTLRAVCVELRYLYCTLRAMCE